MYWTGGGWDVWPAVHMIFWLVVLAAFAFWVVTMTHHRDGGAQGDDRPRRSSALELLDERYAKGEIARDEYLARKQDIRDR